MHGSRTAVQGSSAGALAAVFWLQCVRGNQTIRVLGLYPGRSDSTCFRGRGVDGVHLQRRLAHSYYSVPVCAIYTVGDTQENAQIGPEVLTPPCHKLSFSGEA